MTRLENALTQFENAVANLETSIESIQESATSAKTSNTVSASMSVSRNFVSYLLRSECHKKNIELVDAKGRN